MPRPAEPDCFGVDVDDDLLPVPVPVVNREAEPVVGRNVVTSDEALEP